MSGKIALVFPGQGSQYVGMARDLYDRSFVARQTLEDLQDAVDFDLLRIMFEGPEEELTATQNAQPALLAHSLAALAAWSDFVAEPKPAYVAGHSLGEYTALVAAGALRDDDAIRLVRTRGELMARAGESRPGAMAAVLGMDAEPLAEVLAGLEGEAGTVVIANYNSPGQIVISGDPDAVKAAGRAAKAAGARGAIPLKVSGAFHSPLMAPLAEKFAGHLAATRFVDAHVPVFCNVDAAPHTAAEELRDCVRRQLTGSVMWQASVERMAADGVEVFFEVGPKDVLTKMIPRIAKGTTAVPMGTWEQIQGAWV